MATRTVYDISLKTLEFPLVTNPPSSIATGDDVEFANITTLSELKQILDNFIDDQITPAVPSAPPKPLLSIKVMRKQIYEEDNP